MQRVAAVEGCQDNRRSADAGVTDKVELIHLRITAPMGCWQGMDLRRGPLRPIWEIRVGKDGASETALGLSVRL